MGPRFRANGETCTGEPQLRSRKGGLGLWAVPSLASHDAARNPALLSQIREPRFVAFHARASLGFSRTGRLLPSRSLGQEGFPHCLVPGSRGAAKRLQSSLLCKELRPRFFVYSFQASYFRASRAAWLGGADSSGTRGTMSLCSRHYL